MPETRNLCAQLPLDLHQRVCEAREAAGLTTAQYITNLLIEYYEMKENGGNEIMANEKTRTMAFQISEELFQRIKAHLERESARLGRKVTQTGPKEAMAGQPVNYVLSGIANNSNVRLDNFYWRDTLPAQVRLNTIVTGTYNFPGVYKITYRVNGGEYRTLADNLSTSRNYNLQASPAALGLAANERVTEIMFVFGQAPAGFAQVEKPQIKCTAVAGLKAGSSFVNIADVGGTYNGG